MREKIFNLRDFLLKGIWSIRLSDLSPKKAKQIKAIRILLLSIRGIFEDKIQQRAAALTLYTLLSIVPVLAIGFGIAKGFGYDQYLKGQIESYLTTQEASKIAHPDQQADIDYSKAYRQIAEQLINFADSMLAKTKGGLMAVIALGILLWSVMKVLNNIESSFNAIWQIKKPRPFIRKLTDYIAMMFITPIFVISTTIALVTLQSVKVHSLLSPFLFILVKLSPIFLIIIMFTFMFIIMPNTRVKFTSGLVGGVIAGIIFYLTQKLYFYFQVGISNYNAIYGGFAALPLFLLIMQLSWQIILLGAKFSFSTQNVDMFEFETETVHMSDYSRRILSMLLVHRVIQNFTTGLKPLTAHDLSHELKIPIRMIKALLTDLVDCNIFSEVTTKKPKVMAYQPAQYIERFSIKFVMDSIDKHGENYIHKHDSTITNKLIEIHDKFFEKIDKLPENILLKDL